MSVFPELDRVYVLEAGNDVYEQLFPRPNKQGERPLPLPVAIRYQPADSIAMSVMFVPARIVRQIGALGPDVRPTVFYATVGDRTFTIDLSFGEEPEAPDLEFLTPEEQVAFMALLRSATGTFE